MNILCAIFREQNSLKETRSKKFEEYKILNQIKIWRIKASGDDGVEETLLSIPNRTVKLYSANGTAWETVWESRTLPGKNKSYRLISIAFCVLRRFIFIKFDKYKPSFFKIKIN